MTPEKLPPQSERGKNEYKPIAKGYDDPEGWDTTDPENIKDREKAISVLSKLTVQRTREILSDPTKLEKFTDNLDSSYNSPNRRFRSEYPIFNVVLVKMIDSVKNDTTFLQKIINLYKTTTVRSTAVVCEMAVEKISLGDDTFFKKVFEEARVRGLGLRSELLKRIKDQAYKVKYIEQNRLSKDPLIITEMHIALQGISNRAYLQKLAADKQIHNSIRKEAEFMLK